MLSQRLKQYLDSQNIKYVSINHSLAFTALEVAESAHVPAEIMAKTVIIKLNGKLAMAVIPANAKLDRHHLGDTFGAKDVELADEADFARAFPDCEVGAMPPFGNLYDMEVFTAEDLGKHESVAFNAGSHSEIVKMSYKDYERLVSPKIIRLPA
ncbi:MAG: YbaK/EbsC family protein [Pseudomonadota bacterium]